jgi:hypothetical protein
MRGGRIQGTYAYKSIALPAVGETIFVQKIGPDHQGDERILTALPPVAACVTRVRAGTITASTIDSAAAA